MLWGLTPLFSAPAGVDPRTLLPVGSTNLRTTGLAAPTGTVAIDANGKLWVKVGSAATAWVSISGLSGDEIENVAPASGTDATFTIPANTDAVLISGKAAITAAALASNLRFNGNAATREQSRRCFTDGASIVEATQNGASVEMDTPLNSFEAFVICTGAVKIARVTTGWYRDAATDLGGIANGTAHWFDAAALTSLVLRLNAGAFSATGTKLTSRKVWLP